MSTITRVLASLALPRTTPGLLRTGNGVVQSMTGNPLFPAPTPPLATVTTDLGALSSAETLVVQRVLGAVPARDEQKRIVLNDLHALKGYVQMIANATPVTAAHVIEAAGMAVKQTTHAPKPPLAVTDGLVSGTLRVFARAAADRASYEWGYSLDDKSWTSLPPSLQAKTVITGLTPGSMVYVRVRSVTKTGPSDWSQVVATTVK